MSTAAKTAVVSDKDIGSLPSSVTEISEGHVSGAETGKASFLHRLHEFIKLKDADAQSGHGRWSNAG